MNCDSSINKQCVNFLLLINLQLNSTAFSFILPQKGGLSYKSWSSDECHSAESFNSFLIAVVVFHRTNADTCNIKLLHPEMTACRPIRFKHIDPGMAKNMILWLFSKIAKCCLTFVIYYNKQPCGAGVWQTLKLRALTFWFFFFLWFLCCFWSENNNAGIIRMSGTTLTKSGGWMYAGS